VYLLGILCLCALSGVLLLASAVVMKRQGVRP
jgi:hypothetical protein